jgi:hypothetical protein
MTIEAPVTVYTATSTFGYEPIYPGEVKRAARIIRDEYPDTEFTALDKSLAEAEPGAHVFFDGGRERFDEEQEVALLRAAEVEKRDRDRALAAESEEDRKQREAEEVHRAKVLAMPYKPSPGFGPDGFPVAAEV